MKLDINPQQIPGFVLWQVSKMWQHTLAAAVKPFGIGSTEFVVLGNAVRLSKHGRHATQIMLTEVTQIDRMTASQTLRSLEKKHLIKRTDPTGDKRTFHITPTERGIKLADNALGEVIRVHTAFFAPLKDDAGQFLATMQKLIQENSNERAI